MNLYTLRTEDGTYRITKFDSDLNPESSYVVSPSACECPQWVGRQKQCRHMKMLPLMVDRADSPWFFCFEQGTWHDPLGQVGSWEPRTGLDPEPWRKFNQGEPTGQADEMTTEQAEAHSRVEDMLDGAEGVTPVSLANPAELHCTIAEAVGEPYVYPPPGDGSFEAVQFHKHEVVDTPNTYAGEGFTEEACPGHVASNNDPMVCGRCGIHIDSLRPPEDAGEGPGPSTLAAVKLPSPSQEGLADIPVPRGEPAPNPNIQGPLRRRI